MRRVLGNLTAMHKPLMDRCPYTLTIGGVEPDAKPPPVVIPKATEVAFAARSSWIHCIGGTLPSDWPERTCHMKRVCLDRDTKSFRFYSSHGFMDFDGMHLMSLKDIPIANLRVQREPDANDVKSPFHLELVFGSVPVSLVMFDRPVALFDPFWPVNWGHALGDDILPVFRALSIFDLLKADGDVQFLTTRNCKVGCCRVDCVFAFLIPLKGYVSQSLLCCDVSKEL
jgi:hypothetical protein